MDDGLSIVLPVFNEEKNIKNVISDIFKHVPSYIQDFEAIVINDGSTDSSYVVLDTMKASLANLKILSHKKNKGYGYAIRLGIQSATKEWIFIMDADGQFQINDFAAFWMKRQDNDFILGFRKKRKDNLYRLFLGGFGSIVSSLLLRKRINDINCGFKLFRRNDLQSLPLNSSGNSIYFEILCNLFKNREDNFLQCPVSHYPRKYGKQRGGGFKTIIKILSEGVAVLGR